jgi:serine/threonine-protein kinase
MTGTGDCPFCGAVMDGGQVPSDCPFQGELGCPMSVNVLDDVVDPLEETIAYHPEDDDQAVEPDGFPEVDDLVGRSLGQYRLGSIIGRGQMGRVYRGEHGGLGRACAIKVMNPGLVERYPKVVERFWAEARAVAGLVHPHIVTVHNLGTDRGYHYIEMEYVPGGNSLKESLIRDGAMEPVRATSLVRHVSLALGAAHRAGLVHRDVKPANVLLAADGRAKLADFGLVRRLADESTGTPLAGTPTFMAPELFAGKPASPASDLYAVGVMYYYLLSARLPFASDQINQLIRLHRRAPVPEIRRLAPDVPDETAAIIERLLAKEPADRFASADDLAETLRQLIGQLRDTDSLVREALEGVDCFIQHGGREQYRLIMPLPADRLHEVYVEVVQGRKGIPLLQIYSVCAPAEPRHYEFALRLNSEMTIGGLSIREVHGQPMFVMTRTYVRAHVTSADIRAAVLEIARRGDWVEQQLTHSDVF